MNSPVELVNLALTEIGNTSHINDLNESSEEARVAKVCWQACLERALEEGDWKFATRRLSLTPLASTRTNWEFEFTLPQDFVSLLDIVVPGAVLPPAEVRTEYDIESTASAKVLVTNLDVIEIRYISKSVVVPLFTPKFTDALIILLASKFAAGIKKDARLSFELEQRYELKVAQASAHERNQRETQKLEPATPSLRARGGVSALDSTD